MFTSQFDCLIVLTLHSFHWVLLRFFATSRALKVKFSFNCTWDISFELIKAGKFSGCVNPLNFHHWCAFKLWNSLRFQMNILLIWVGSENRAIQDKKTAISYDACIATRRKIVILYYDFRLEKLVNCVQKINSWWHLWNLPCTRFWLVTFDARCFTWKQLSLTNQWNCNGNWNRLFDVLSGLKMFPAKLTRSFRIRMTRT